ncbi:hypothetical protein [Glycomyces dulcitolivorans]|uniref:hypothetical protein n=1 Tax=Glycomyces dulcitolivorans TaxID=2200759 RepID=UPI000DD355CB|nr:hypothetical protein [Glycomyces dulcitolivorans]
MRQLKRTGSAVAAAAVIAGSVFAGTAAAQAEDPAPAAEGAAAPATVTLPTGDRVTVLPNGSKAIEPAAGREDASFITPSSPTGDVIVVPTDRVAAIQSGDEDPRRYNVSELLRAGESDAAAAPESELDDRAYAGLVPDTSAADLTAAEDAQKLAVTVLNRDGKAPDGASMYWAERSGTGFDAIDIDENGNGSTALPPGEYVIVVDFWDDPTEANRGEYVLGMISVTIGDGPAELVVDASDAAPISVGVEQPDAELLDAIVTIDARAGDVNLGSGNFLSTQTDAFLLPEPDLPEFELGFNYQTVLTSPEGAPDPYVYNLAFVDGSGYPEDPAYTVADDDLATVETDYRDLGTPFAGRTCDYGDYTGRQIGMGFCRLVPTAVPSERTMYYTADPETVWGNLLSAGERDESGRMIDGFGVDYRTVFEPGTTERVMPRGGLSAAPSETFRINDAGTEVFGAVVYAAAGGNDENLVLIGPKGNMTLSRDGETIASAEGMDFYRDRLFTELPADAGRYTLAADLTQPSTTSVFGTDASIEWSFDSEGGAVDEFVNIPLPVVQLTSDAIEGGYAPKRGCQEITLDLRTYEYGPDVDAVDMTFEVSYDDGATWKSVDIDRDGDTATAELVHPRGATWVSVRMTAVDDRGTEVTHTTIRSYGLK